MSVCRFLPDLQHFKHSFLFHSVKCQFKRHGSKNDSKTVLILCLLMLVVLFFAGDALAEKNRDISPEQLLSETDRLLDAVGQSIVADLQRKERETEEATQGNVKKSTGNALTEQQLLAEKASIESQRTQLLQQINEWSRSDVYSIDLITTKELNKAMATARSIANYYGLDVEKLGKLYEMGKKTIKNSDFVVPDRVPPDKDESYSRYFQRLFIFAHEREKELAEFRSKTQDYRVRLFKRVALVYMRALLSSGERFPQCTADQTEHSIQVSQTAFPSLGCQDPVVDHLRKYVQAIQEIASAESDNFAAEAEKLIAEQSLIGDVAAGIPLVGDAIDFYSLYSGEDLAGQCLSRFSYGITVVFSALPFVPSSWIDQLVKRVPGLEAYLSRFLLWAAESAEWSGEMLQGFAFRAGVSPEQLNKVIKVLTAEINVTRSGVQLKAGAAGHISQSSRAKLSRELEPAEIVYENVKIAEEGQLIMRNLPKELREKMEQTSRRVMSANLEAVQGSRKNVIQMSNMVPEHLAEFEKLARSKDSILVFRAVNADATDLIKANYGTKWMDVKPKSSDWGPHKGFLPFEQKFSKLNNPANVSNLSPEELVKAAGKVEKYSDLAQKCLAKANCFKTPLVLPDGNCVYIWKNGDQEIPILRNKTGQFIDPETKSILEISDDATRPMEVMAGKNAKGEIVPLTADYDLLAMGTRSDTRAPKYSDETGYISAEEEGLVGEINEAGKRAGYTGGNLSHHGPENQFFASPGALAEDPVMTIVDPQKGLITVPRCDGDCMQHWCKTSGQCGGLPLCVPGAEIPPCLPIDPDRLLKDYFHYARFRGYTNLRPNSVWDWGEANGLSGWTPKVLLDKSGKDAGKWVFGQYRPGQGVVSYLRKSMGQTARRSALLATKYLFSCPGAGQ